MVDEVLVDYALLLVEVTSELVLDIDLVVLVLDFAKLFKCHSNALNDLVELRAVNDD